MILWNCSKILLRLGDGCLTGCNGCNERFKKKQYFPIEDMLSVVERSWELFSKDVRYFLFGQDPLGFPELETLLDTIRDVNTNEICIHLSDIDNYTANDYLRIHSFLQKDRHIGIYISTSFETIKHWKWSNIIRFCKEMIPYEDQLFIQIYYNSLADIRIKNIALLHYLFPRKRISFTPNIVIDHEQKTVSDHIKKCKFLDTIDVDDEIVTFSPPRLDDFEFEVTRSGDIIPHTPRCYMAKIFISNIYLPKNQILEHFREFIAYIEKVNTKTGNFERDCYSCIFSENLFDYRSLWK